jgi:AcrR family transcriptional regulator
MTREGTPRARARAAALEEIKRAARTQMAERGAAALSVRHVAREVGMCSSGVYRYFGSRDELLTALILDAYNDLGTEVETAESVVDRADLFERWWSAASAIRRWARAHPQEYGLVFGSPVPGYVAPQDTVVPAARVPFVLAAILRDAHEVHLLADELTEAPQSDEPLRGIDPCFMTAGMPLEGLPEAVVAAGIRAWIELFGLISFELFGHLTGSVLDGDRFFRIACERMARELGMLGIAAHA